jgi:hypothetical protein
MLPRNAQNIEVLSTAHKMWRRIARRSMRENCLALFRVSTHTTQTNWSAAGHRQPHNRSSSRLLLRLTTMLMLMLMLFFLLLLLLLFPLMSQMITK